MMRSETFTYRRVETLPQVLDPGVLYHVDNYATAAHLCACGCGHEVATALGPDRWRLVVKRGRVTMTPSIGNSSFPCRSHYFITCGCVRWAGEYTPAMIARARRFDNPRVHRASPVRPVQPAATRLFWLQVGSWLRRVFLGK